MNRSRAIVDGGIVAGLLFAAYLFLVIAPAARSLGFDAYAYWALDLDDPYAQTAGGFGAFTYTPVFARLFAPASAMPWHAFLLLWLGVLVGTVVWLGHLRPRLVLGLLALPPVALELYHGNIHLLLAAAIVIGFRYPAAWAFVLLSKVTPGVGLVWFAARREWRALLVAIGATAVIAAVSFAIDRRLWFEWIAAVGATAGGAPLNQYSIAIPLAIRLPLAAVLVAWAARTDRAWLVPVGASLAMPVLWPSAFATSAAAVTLFVRPPTGYPAAEGPSGQGSEPAGLA